MNVALAVDAHQDELQLVISEVAVDIHGSFVSKSSPDHPEYDPLRLVCCWNMITLVGCVSVEALIFLFSIIREVVINLLLGSVSGTKLMKAEVFAAGRTKLSREITNNEYIKVFTRALFRLFCVSTKVWF